MMISFDENLQRVKKLWFIVLLSGVLHLAVWLLYLTTEMSSYLWLSRIFTLTYIAKGIGELIFLRIFFQRIGFLLALGPLTDIAFGLLLIIAPIVPLILLPFFIATSLLIRGIVRLILFKPETTFKFKRLATLRTEGIIKILIAGLILGFTLSDRVSIWLTGAVIFRAGLIQIYISICLKKWLVNKA